MLMRGMYGGGALAYGAPQRPLVNPELLLRAQQTPLDLSTRSSSRGSSPDSELSPHVNLHEFMRGQGKLFTINY